MLTGMTIAEYYRDMGLNVVLLVDSVTGWCDALRHRNSQLCEVRADSGYPAYLGSAVGSFFERSGVSDTKGSVTTIGV